MKHFILFLMLIVAAGAHAQPAPAPCESSSTCLGGGQTIKGIPFYGVTANTRIGTLPAGAVLLGVVLTETAGHTVSVSIGSTSGGTDIMAATSVTASTTSGTNPTFTKQIFSSLTAVFLNAASWNSASINGKLWYLY